MQQWLLGNYIHDEPYERYIKQRLESTCDWILCRPWFLDWASPDFPEGLAKILWINGPAGFGKSILCARVVDHLSSILETPVAHFFFSSDFESRRDPFVAVRSWESQMISYPASFELIHEKWATQQGQKATRGSIIHLLRQIAKAIPGCTFTLDGLDECNWLKEASQDKYGDTVSSFMEALLQSIEGTATRILVVSRDEPEIRACFSDSARATSTFEHKITPEDVQSDVVSYARRTVHIALEKRKNTVKEDISQKLADRCNGQFLWIRLHRDSLKMHSWRNQKQLEREINSTPSGIENVYEQNWMKITNLPEEDRHRALSLLRWTAFALRPLTVSEVTEALAISEYCDEVCLDELPENIDRNYVNNGILSYCGSLLEVRSAQEQCDTKLETVHLAHFSVKQYLLRHIPTNGRLLQLNSTLGCSVEQVENTVLAKMCLRYMNCLMVWQRDHCAENSQILGSLLDYAAGSWHCHASLGDARDARVVELANRLFDTRRPNWCFWREWMDLNDKGDRVEQEWAEGSSAGPVYYAAWLGLTDTVDFLIQERRHDINERGTWGRTPLAGACEKGHLRIAEKLLGNGADATVTDNTGR